jgi:hypothetical protein
MKTDRQPARSIGNPAKLSANEFNLDREVVAKWKN